MPSWLVVVGERLGLQWVLTSSRFAFSAKSRSEVDALRVGDRLFLVTTRGCFHNPGRDRTRVIGQALVASPVEELQEPVAFLGRTFTRGCDLTMVQLAPWPEGPELVPLVPRLEAFPDKGPGWAMRIRRALVGLTDADANVLDARLGPVAVTEPLQSVIETYPFAAGQGRDRAGSRKGHG